MKGNNIAVIENNPTDYTNIKWSFALRVRVSEPHRDTLVYNTATVFRGPVN